MLTEKIVLTDSILAAADLDNANRFVGMDGDVCAANAKAAGVLEVATLSGEYAPITVWGIKIVVAGGVVNAGDRVTSDSTGRAVACTDIAGTIASGQVAVLSTGAQPTVTVAGAQLSQGVNGVARTAAGQAGDLILVYVNAA